MRRAAAVQRETIENVDLATRGSQLNRRRLLRSDSTLHLATDPQRNEYARRTARRKRHDPAGFERPVSNGTMAGFRALLRDRISSEVNRPSSLDGVRRQVNRTVSSIVLLAFLSA